MVRRLERIKRQEDIKDAAASDNTDQSEVMIAHVYDIYGLIGETERVVPYPETVEWVSEKEDGERNAESHWNRRRFPENQILHCIHINISFIYLFIYLFIYEGDCRCPRDC